MTGSPDWLPDRLYPILGPPAGELHITTIHSFFQSVLDDHPQPHPWGGGFQILDGREQIHRYLGARREAVAAG